MILNQILTHFTIILFVFLAPLVKIKQAITQLKKENTQMDIREGVVEHILLQAKLKDKTSQNKQAHTTNPSSTQYQASY